MFVKVRFFLVLLFLFWYFNFLIFTSCLRVDDDFRPSILSPETGQKTEKIDESEIRCEVTFF